MSSEDSDAPRRLSMQQRIFQLAVARTAVFEEADRAVEDGWVVTDLNDGDQRTSFEPPERDADTVSAVIDMPKRSTRLDVFLRFFTHDYVEALLEQAENDCPHVRLLHMLHTGL